MELIKLTIFLTPTISASLAQIFFRMRYAEGTIIILQR